uniref:D-isomer specific 2-hydroxyacid dehydrogenase NAD-binding domain-containing protein n=1 Tax=Emiliania huxleyi TaxID=2903 RepID=A0A7S3WB05_EMIHU
MLCVVLLPPEEWPGRASAPTSVELRFVRSASELDAADAAAAEGIVAVPGCDIGALRGLLAALPRCAWLHSFSAGVDGIAPVLRETPDTLRASNARGAFTSSLAEYALAAALHFNKQVPRCMANRAAGRWERFTMNVLRGKTLGLLGYGSIARATAKLAAAFGMRIIALRRNVGGEAGEVVPEATYGYDDRAAFFGAADFIVCSLPATGETRHFVGAAAFEAMKESAVFISLGRGDVVDEAALVAALSRGRICGAALDVFEQANPLTHHAHWALHVQCRASSCL